MRRIWGLLAAIALVTSIAATTASANDTLPPSSWPNTSATKPRLDGWPHAVRLSGDDRYQTGLTAALTLRGSGSPSSYPFGSPDPATTSGWFGLGTCPRAVIIVAGDSPADALAASTLSDPTGNSTEPFLQRTAAADPLFDPVGGFQKVDTDFAPILVTRSARQGATSLDLATRLAAQDMRSGGCLTARQAIVVGGNSAVPAAVETELVSIGYEQVFRVAGSSRYETAKKVAESLGTAVAPGSPTPNTCVDPLADDGAARMNFYANSVVEFRATAQQCRLLHRSVVLTDGVVGADAIAAGWWTSYWQVPVLLHDGSEVLPTATAQALQTLNIDNVIVLGGSGRVSDNVAQQAALAASASIVRVSGASRYDTSVSMAQNFGGWFSTGRGTEFAGSLACIAASSGGSALGAGRGWADALAAGPWCGRASASGRNAPTRALAPTTGARPAISTVASNLSRPSHDAVPILLVPVGETALPPSVDELLSAAFNPADNWCTGVSNSEGCLAPGFAVVFGGSALIPDVVVSTVSRIVSGGAILAAGDRQPGLGSVFHTALSMAPVFDDLGATADNRVCVGRGDYSQARWLVALAAETSALDLVSRGRYVRDADGIVRSSGQGSPACVSVTPGQSSQFSVRAVSLAGPASSGSVVVTGQRLSLAAPLAAGTPNLVTGTDSATDQSAGGFTTWTFSLVNPGVSIISRGISTSVTDAGVTITLTRGTNTATQTGPDTFTATFSLVTALGTVTGTATGEALLSLDPGQGASWKLRGRSLVSGGTWNMVSGSGGFSAQIAIGGAGLADDSISWQVDANANAN